MHRKMIKTAGSALYYVLLLLRSTAFNLAAYPTFLLYMWIIYPLTVVLRLGDACTLKMLEYLVDFLLYSAKVICGITYDVIGQIPSEPCIIVANHQSVLECIIFYKVFNAPAIIARRELAMFFTCHREISLIFIERNSSSALREMCNKAEACLLSGKSVLVFPEGTRKAPGEEIKLLPGLAGLYAAKTSNIFVPVVVNTGSLWGRMSYIKRPGKITVKILPPISCDSKIKPRQFLANIEKEMNDAQQDMCTV